MNLNKTVELVNKSVRNLSSYHLAPVETDIKLNQNESPVDWPSEIKNEIAEFVKSRPWNRYPNFIPEELKRKIGELHKLSGKNVIVGNGSNEMLLSLIFAFGGSEKNIIISEPTFTVYKLLASGFGCNVISIPLKDNLSYDIDKIKESVLKNSGSFLIICTPNNPTGTTLDKKNIESILEVHTGILLLDQAYIEFGGYSAVELLDKYPNLIIARTFSKALAGAGLRIGYLLGNSDIIAQINKIKLPYNINFITEFAAIKILENQEISQKRVQKILDEKKRVYNFFKSIPFEKLYHSSANFILIKTEKKDELFEYLKNRSILIRDVSSYPMLKNCLRIGIGTKNENDKLIDELKTFFNPKDHH